MLDLAEQRSAGNAEYYDRQAAKKVLKAVVPNHAWLKPFIPMLSDGYAENGYDWLWDELTRLERLNAAKG